jgi:serine/threonine protein phosphatase PrpC
MADLRWGATTNPGLVRTENEDTYVTEPMVFAVADGMGGHQAGEVASALAASIVRDRLGRGASSEDDAESVVHEVNAAIFGAARANAAQSGMGTTLTALAVLKAQGQGSSLIDEQLVLLNVGDSRTYLFRNGRLSRVTVDHSYVQELVATGHITMEEARTHPRRNIVTRALGIEQNVRADMWTMAIVRGDRFVLCSDGLVDEVPDSEITQLVANVEDPQALSEQLVALANSHGGRDNVTVVVVDVMEGADPPDPTEDIAIDPDWAAQVDDAAIWNEGATGESDDTEPKAADGTRLIPTTAAGASTMPGSRVDGLGATATAAISSMPTVAPPAAPLGAAESIRSNRAATPTLPPPAASSGARPSASMPLGAADASSTSSPTLPPASGTPFAPETGNAPGGRDAGEVPDGKSPRKATLKPPRRRRLTGGLFLFVVVLAAIIIATFTLIAVHARSGYFVAFHGDKVAVYKGQPGGVLWFQPTLVQDSALTRGQLDPTLIQLVNQHVTYSSAEEAAAFITGQVIPTTTTVAPTTTTTTPAATTSTTSVGQTTTTVASGP